jgi:hypothetical protein
VTGYFSRRGSFVWAAKRNVAAIKREKPVIRRRVVAKRPPVSSDKPSALLFVIGFMALAAIGWVMFLMLPVSAVQDEVDWTLHANRTFGEYATTVTLVSPNRSGRILLVQDEDQHMESDELSSAVDSAIAWYEARDFTVDSKPDLDSLGLIAFNSGDAKYKKSVGLEFGEALGSRGYSAMARLTKDNLGDPVLQIITRSNVVWNTTYDGDFAEADLWVPGMLPSSEQLGEQVDDRIDQMFMN